MRRVLVLLICMLAVVLAWPAAALSRGPADGKFGVVAASSAEDPPDQGEVQLMRQAGISTYRIAFSWWILNPGDGSFDWSTTDAAVGPAAAGGVQPLPHLVGSPRWATGCTADRDTCLWVPPTGDRSQKQAWRSFLRAAVARYGPKGDYWELHPELPYRPIRTWQIWNEPNLKGYFQPRPSPRGYAKLLRISARTIRRMDPGARIVMAGLAPGTSKGNVKMADFLRRLYRVRGIESSFDAVAVHPYATRLSGLARLLDLARHVIEQSGDGRTRIWVTEVGWSSRRNAPGLSKGPKGQARMVRKSFELFIAQRKAWRLGKIYYFSWKDAPFGDPNAWWRTAGFFDSNLQPKPAWGQFQRLMIRYG